MTRIVDLAIDHWNTHYIQKSRYDTVPDRPDELSYLPENSGFDDFRCPITEQLYNFITLFILFRHGKLISRNYKNLINYQNYYKLYNDYSYIIQNCSK